MCWPSWNLLNPQSEEFASVASVARGRVVSTEIFCGSTPAGSAPPNTKPPPHRCLQGEPLAWPMVNKQSAKNNQKPVKPDLFLLSKKQAGGYYRNYGNGA